METFVLRTPRPKTLDIGVSLAVVTASLLVFVQQAHAGDRSGDRPGEVPDSLTSAEHGYWLLRHKPYLPPDFDQTTFDMLWSVWPEPLRSQARDATPEERRRLTFSRYGLVEPLESTGTGPALGYVPTASEGWVMNCLACHGGKVAGQTIPGLPNSHTALQTLTEDVRMVKLLRFQSLAHLDQGSMTLPLSTTNGTTNSVVFGIVLGSLRKPDMSVDTSLPIPELFHHDMDAPPFWNVKKKSRLYIDGFVQKGPRPLLQFMLIPRNGRDTILSWEDDYRDVLAWIESVPPPKYPWHIDSSLAERGAAVFAAHCTECHGTYGDHETYPEVTVPIDVVGTDRVRLDALSPDHRRWMKVGWMSHFGADEVRLDPGGYVAPPLDGVWASAPYFHNGSVPTLWHVLHPDQRPAAWLRTEDGYDQERVGLEVTEFPEVPESAATAAERRRYFDTAIRGKSAAGHRFPDVLTEDEKRAVLEYLKTL
jgi:mono/diheme cytochrome c family protein